LHNEQNLFRTHKSCANSRAIYFCLFAANKVVPFTASMESPVITDGSASPPSVDTKLPPEIWCYIFRLAAAEPAALFDTSPLEPGDDAGRTWTQSDRRYTSPQNRNDLAERNTDRLSFILVSKHWYNLAVDLFFEYVLIRTEWALIAFSRIIERQWDSLQSETQASSLPGSALHVGRFVKFLHIYPRKEMVWTITLPDMFHIASSIKLCPNAQILVLDLFPDGTGNRMTTDALSDEILKGAKSLRYVDCRIDFLSLLQLSFDHSETIEVLSVRPIQTLDFTALQPPSSKSVIFSRVHTFNMKAVPVEIEMMTWLNTCAFPALLRLRWKYDCNSRAKPEVLQFYRMHGAHITSLDLGNTPNRDLPTILPLFPSVREISIPVADYESILLILPKLVGVGLYLDFAPWPPTLRAMMSMLIPCMNSILGGCGPNLAYVRIEEFDQARFSTGMWHIKQLVKWGDWAMAWGEIGVGFEFSSGESIMAKALEEGFLWRFSEY
jgi:hypothetical protein